MKFNFKKNILIAMFVWVTSTCLFAEGFGTELLRNSDFSLNCPFSLMTGDVFKFTKADVGAEVKIGTDLVSTKNNFFTFGIATTYNINWFLFNREEIRNFYMHSLVESLTFNFLIGNGFNLRLDVGCGIGISKINALSIDGKKLDNYYNSFVIASSLIMTHRLFDIGSCTLNWNAGIEAKFFLEEKSCFQSFGIVAGLMFKVR